MTRLSASQYPKGFNGSTPRWWFLRSCKGIRRTLTSTSARSLPTSTRTRSLAGKLTARGSRRLRRRRWDPTTAASGARAPRSAACCTPAAFRNV
eukprot:5021998-Pyramimonas_sp.AAC.2